MHDANEFEHEAALEADVCVVGGGPAGISLALSLADAGVSVLLLESGGEHQEPADRDLNVGRNTGLDYYDLDFTRNRALGGGSARWAGWCRQLDPSDFEAPPGSQLPGWPIGYDDLAPFYEEAAELCQIPPIDRAFDTDGLPAIYGPPFVGGGVDVAVWRGSPPTKFGVVYKDRLERSTSIRVLLHATATRIDLTSDGTASMGVTGVSASGHRFTVRATDVVLCAGAMETARLLLASNDVHGDGVGNANDMVGRTFMEHPHLVTARLQVLPDRLTGRRRVDGVDRGLGGVADRLAMQRPSGARKAAYVIDPEVRRVAGTLNFSTHVQTVSNVTREDSEAYQAFKLVVGNLRSPAQFLEQVRTGSLPEGTGDQVRRLVTGAPEIAQVVWEEALKRPSELAFYTQCEQSPNRESRVTLRPRDRDATGLPRIDLHWRLSREDKESVVRSHEILADQFMASGLGVVVPEPAFRDEGSDWGPHLRGGHHHMGTARMGHDPKHSVVDVDGRVHGVDGLYVGDSSVFPTVGYANPLLTTVAIARRLGAHLRRTRSRVPVAADSAA